jgi:hypothetical protein
VGNTDAGFILGTGKLLIKVPPTMRFTFDGQMPEWLQAKDLILQVSLVMDVCVCGVMEGGGVGRGGKERQQRSVCVVVGRQREGRVTREPALQLGSQGCCDAADFPVAEVVQGCNHMC